MAAQGRQHDRVQQQPRPSALGDPTPPRVHPGPLGCIRSRLSRSNVVEPGQEKGSMPLSLVALLRPAPWFLWLPGHQLLGPRSRSPAQVRGPSSVSLFSFVYPSLKLGSSRLLIVSISTKRRDGAEPADESLAHLIPLPNHIGVSSPFQPRARRAKPRSSNSQVLLIRGV